MAAIVTGVVLPGSTSAMPGIARSRWVRSPVPGSICTVASSRWTWPNWMFSMARMLDSRPTEARINTSASTVPVIVARVRRRLRVSDRNAILAATGSRCQCAVVRVSRPTDTGCSPSPRIACAGAVRAAATAGASAASTPIASPMASPRSAVGMRWATTVSGMPISRV